MGIHPDTVEKAWPVEAVANAAMVDWASLLADLWWCNFPINIVARAAYSLSFRQTRLASLGLV
jgi:hypothetical protein